MVRLHFKDGTIGDVGHGVNVLVGDNAYVVIDAANTPMAWGAFVVTDWAEIVE